MIARISLIAVVLFAGVSQAFAQTCTPTYGAGQTYWSNQPGNLTTLPDANSAHAFMLAPVPPGEIWKMRSISVSTDDSRSIEYFVEHLVNVPGGNHYHRIGGGIGGATPVLDIAPADAAAVILLPGERLAVRSNPPDGQMNGLGMALYYSYFSFPEACLARALGMEPPTSGGGSSTPPPDFSALITAAQEAAQKLDALAQSVPE